MILASLLALAAPQATAATAPDAACRGADARLPPELAGWSRPAAATAGASAAGAAPLIPGTAVEASLRPTRSIAYALPPKKPGEPASSGGIFSLTVAAAGRYRVALGAGAWVDVLRGATPVASVAHAHGPACSNVRKMVDFDLGPGRYVIQLAGSTAPRLRLLVARIG